MTDFLISNNRLSNVISIKKIGYVTLNSKRIWRIRNKINLPTQLSRNVFIKVLTYKFYPN